MRFIVVLFLSCVCFLCPVRVYGHSYSGTSASMLYGTFNGSDSLCCFSEWFYSNSGSGAYMWSAGAVEFSLTITKYTSTQNYQNNNPVSTNTTTWVCSAGEWAVQQWNETTARVSGTKYIVLDQGYIHAISLAPKATGSFRPSYYAQFSTFWWNGEVKTATVDLLWPPDQ